MKQKPWCRCGFIAAAAIVSAAAIWLMNRPSPQLSKAVVAKLFEVRRGVRLTVAQVEALVKAPPGDYSGGLHDHDTGRWLGYQLSEMCLGRVVLRSPDDVAEFQTRMSSGKLYGWWGRNRALIVEADDNSVVRAISYQYCDIRPKGWLAGLVWQIDTLTERED